MSEIEFGQINDPNSWDTMTGTGVLLFATVADARKAKELFITLERELAEARTQVEALKQVKRPWTPEFTKSVIDGQVKQIDELTEKLRSERVKHEQEVEALTAARDKYLAGLNQALSEFQSLHERHTESERAAEALRAEFRAATGYTPEEYADMKREVKNG